jgi:hypothetical protein
MNLFIPTNRGLYLVFYQVIVDNIQPLIISLLLLSKTHKFFNSILHIPTNEGW